MQTILITGASDGIGAEITRQLARENKHQVKLILAARNTTRLQEVASDCRATGAAVLVVPTDVSNPQACQLLIEQAVTHFGGLDVLINNAGISAHALFSEVQVQDLTWYEDLMRVNLWGSVWCTHAALPYLKQRQGRIVAVSSLAGLVGVPGRTAYSATKFAMTGFFEALRTELLGSGVSVTTAYPGVVDTQIRYHGFNAKGQAAGVSGLKEDGAMSVKTCAALIIEGMTLREREVVMTFKGKMGRFLKLIAPGLVERLAWAAVKKET